ncbi:hypothetical protein ACJ73_08377 [Blastomyces percursus]|uniref:Uncharacterized protein n=1 Tax=Blastomyces percursus TaxID=1658174 RepID=A0A1J9QVQ1_9EURO|nr:hypothetical protein ACJ73_08377 [Blastomyces percursus]
MNNPEFSGVAYLAVPRLKNISTDYDPNAGSLGPFSRDEVEQLINPKDPDTNSFVVAPAARRLLSSRSSSRSMSGVGASAISAIIIY